MIIEGLFNLIKIVILLPFRILPNIPNLPDSFWSGWNNLLDLIFNNLGLLNVFLNVSTIKIIIPLAIVVINFDKLYKLAMFIIKKLPFSIN